MDHQKIKELIGQPLYEVWCGLCSAIDAAYNAEHLRSGGGRAWDHEYKFRKGGKTLCALYAREKRMGFLIIFGKEERARFESIRNDFSEYIRSTYESAKTYHDGKWEMFEPVDDSLSDEFLRLLAVKRPPDRK